MTALALTVLEPEWDEWWERAACRTADPDLFFPAQPDFVPDRARTLCDGCEVREPCHDHALRHEAYGVWAGMSEQARWRLRKVMHLQLVRPENVPPPDTPQLTWPPEEFLCT